MRGSEFEVVTTAPETETQSWEEEFWKVSWAVLSAVRSANFVECMLARKRKSGPSRCAVPGFVRLDSFPGRLGVESVGVKERRKSGPRLQPLSERRDQCRHEWWSRGRSSCRRPSCRIRQSAASWAFCHPIDWRQWDRSWIRRRKL